MLILSQQLLLLKLQWNRNYGLRHPPINPVINSPPVPAICKTTIEPCSKLNLLPAFLGISTVVLLQGLNNCKSVRDDHIHFFHRYHWIWKLIKTYPFVKTHFIFLLKHRTIWNFRQSFSCNCPVFCLIVKQKQEDWCYIFMKDNSFLSRENGLQQQKWIVMAL